MIETIGRGCFQRLVHVGEKTLCAGQEQHDPNHDLNQATFAFAFAVVDADGLAPVVCPCSPSLSNAAAGRRDTLPQRRVRAVFGWPSPRPADLAGNLASSGRQAGPGLAAPT